MKTTLTPQELEGDAKLMWAELAAQYPTMRELPDPLKRCTRCTNHAAFYTGEKDGEFLCLACGAKVSVFAATNGTRGATDPRQVVADLALEQFEQQLADGHAEAERLLQEAT